ncbi:MAG: hypothetical protein CL521_05770 [Actinobacteria bacterium]|nr:hypothetical protein [Actinomycetota bacterium]
MVGHDFLALTSIPVIGIASQWLSWRVRIPAIITLLISGILIGPVLGFLDPDHLLGNLISPIVSLMVAVILFEGGLSLKLSDIHGHAKILRNLISIGVMVSWVLTSLLGIYVLELDIQLSILLGAVLVVTGPTVIIPLLRHIRLQRTISSILRWEGIVIDPVGATLSVLVFEIILARGSQDALGLALVVIVTTLFAGLILGFLGSFVLISIIKRHWVPEFLQESVSLMLVFIVYTLSHMIQPESGLLAVTIMGIVLANQKIVTIKHIVIFKENLTVLLLSALFVILAARIEMQELLAILDIKSFFFMAGMILVVRPLSVWLSTMRSHLSYRDRFFLCLMAPRGIIAAAIASIFALRLTEVGFEEASRLVPITFLVIIATVSFYGLLGRTFASLLKLQPQQKGILIAGGHSWARQFAKILTSYGIYVIVVDTNKENTLIANQDGIKSIHGSILSKKVSEEVTLGNVGYLLAMTASDETNILSFIEYANIFGYSYVYRLFSKDKTKDLSRYQHGRILFGKGITHTYISTLMMAGSKMKAVLLTEEFDYQKYKKKYHKFIPLCVISEKNKIQFFSYPTKIEPGVNDVLVSIISP